MWINSMPPRLVRALSRDLKPSMGRTRRLMGSRGSLCRIVR
jgi:hypothetical protein